MSLDPWVEALIPLDLLNEADWEEYAGHIEYWIAYEAPNPGTSEWAERAIGATPGVWTAQLCRMQNGVPETPQGIAFCGLCTEYANSRKRERNRHLSLQLLLPGFKAGSKSPHPPCRSGFTRLRHTLYRLTKLGRIFSRREERPDPHNFRGWDFMTCYYDVSRSDEAILAENYENW